MKKILLATLIVVMAAAGFAFKYDTQNQASAEGGYKVADIRVGA